MTIKKTNNTMKHSKLVFTFLFLAATFTACKKDDPVTPEKPKPTIENIEVGLANNELAVIGMDFHFNADILAADQIESVQLIIQQKSTETYSKVWKHEVTWDQYKGAKNATVHKHFDIPADAAEGKYDLLIIVNDQNGTKLEVKKNLSIFSEANLPVNPTLAIFNIFVKGESFYRNGVFTNPGTPVRKGELFNSQVTLSGVKGDGKMYLLLIKKTANHRPKSIDQIDFSKVIVYDVYEHKDLATVESFSNVIFDIKTFTSVRSWPDLFIGAATDNHLPQANPISGDKAWVSGDYYFGVVYKNLSYNMSFFHYIDISIDNS